MMFADTHLEPDKKRKITIINEKKREKKRMQSKQGKLKCVARR